MDEERDKKGIYKKIIVGVIAIVLVAIFLFVIFKDSKYNSLEESMLATTKSYVLNNKFSVQTEAYITLDQLGMTKTLDCNKASGVKVTNNAGVLKYEAYLVCDSYVSKNINTSRGKYIELIGDNPYIIQTNVAFEDPGYKSNNYKVEQATNFKSSPGVYSVTYYVYENNVRKESVVRTIIVSNVADSDAPVITLNGESNVIVKVGNTYTEPGYTAIDKNDGNITAKVTRDSNVNLNKIGEYEIVYSVINSNGKKTSKKRLVSVVSQTLNIYTRTTLNPEEDTNGKVQIILNHTGETYDFTYLPDGSRNSTPLVTYDVDKNGTYKFRVYDKSGNYTEKVVVIDYIDKVAPKGTCDAVSIGGVVTYTVNATDENSGVTGISYYTGYDYSEYLNTATAKYTMNYLEAKVMIKDLAGNVTKVDCSGKKMSEVTAIKIPTSKTMYLNETYQIPLTLTPSTVSSSEVSWEIIGGSSISLDQNGTVKALTVGTSIVKASVKDSTLTATITITVKEKSIGTTNPPDEDDTPSGECGKKAQTLTAYVNGTQISRYAKFTIGVGETLRVTLYMETKCGTVLKLTRTTADGEEGWRNYLSGSSDPFVDRYDSSTFLDTDHFDWVITGNKSTGGKYIHLSQTTFNTTTQFSEIKSFFNIYVKVQ